MGLFSDLFSQNNSADEHIPAIMPPGALDQIRQGIIPTMRTDRIMLTQGEVCHFSERAILMTEKTQKDMLVIRVVLVSGCVRVLPIELVNVEEGQSKKPIRKKTKVCCMSLTRGSYSYPTKMPLIKSSKV